MSIPDSQLPTPKGIATGDRHQESGVGGWKLGVEAQPLVNLQEIAEIELFIVKRMMEFTVGDHASVF